MRLGIVGAGLMGWAHSMALRAILDAGHIEATLEVVYDSEPGRASALAAVQGARPAGSLDELVEGCDAFWVCTPTAAHPPVVEAAVNAGRAVFCEKPLGPNLPSAADMARRVDERGITAQVGLVLRFSPAIRALRALLASGELGEPMTMVLRDDQYFPVQGIYHSTWRGEQALSGGGCLIEHSIHDVDLMRFCLGEVVQVAASTGNFSGRLGVEDLAVASLRFESGVVGEVVSVWHDVISRPSNRRIEVFCRGGFVWLDQEFSGPLHVQTSDDQRVVECRWPGWVQQLPLGQDDIGLAIRSYAEADRAFLEAAASGTEASPSFAEGLIAHRIVDGAYRSAAEAGRPVEL